MIRPQRYVSGWCTDSSTCPYRSCHFVCCALCLGSRLSGGGGAAPHWWGVPDGIFCVGILLYRMSERPSPDLSLLRERSCYDPRKSGVHWPSAQAGFHYGVSLP